MLNVHIWLAEYFLFLTMVRAEFPLRNHALSEVSIIRPRECLYCLGMGRHASPGTTFQKSLNPITDAFALFL